MEWPVRLIMALLGVIVLTGLPVGALVAVLYVLRALRRRDERLDRLERKIVTLEAAAGRVRGPEAAPRAADRTTERPEEPGPAKAPAAAEPTSLPTVAVVARPEPLRAGVKPASPRPARPDLEQWIGARWTTWTGVVAILFAVGLLLRWSIENNLIGPAGRVGLGIASGVALLGLGLFLERRRDLPFLSEGLAGGGLAILYLTLFAAYDRYGFLSSATAFGLMFGVTVAGAAVSVATRRQATAVLAVLGGLITPVLVASEHPDERALLGYLLVLDALVLGVSRYRSWPALNRLAWAGSLVLTIPIFSRSMEPPSLPARLALVTALGLLFLMVPLARSWSERKPAGPLDLVLVAGNAATYFMGIYLTLERGWIRAEAPWAVAMAAVYAAVAEAHRRRVPKDGPTVLLHHGIGATALVIAAPLALEGPWVTLAWAALGVVFFLLATRRGDGGATLGAGLALGLATLRLLAYDPGRYAPGVRVWNVAFAVHLTVVAALAFCGVAAGRLWLRDQGERDVRTILWLTASAALAVLFWREPDGLWPAVLLILEMLALSALARAVPDRAFVFGTALLAGIVLARVMIEDSGMARRAAAELWNGPFVVRIAAALALCVAGAAVARSGAGRAAEQVGKSLRAVAGVALLVVLSVGWAEHQVHRVRDAIGAGAANLVRMERFRLQVGLSVLWTLYAAATLGWGFALRVASVRWAALSLLGFVVLKVFIVDLSGLQAIYRILSFLVLGLVLLAVAFYYQRREGRRTLHS